MNKIRVKVDPSEQGMRLLAFLKEKCSSSCSVKALKRAVDHKLCKVNGKVECFSSHILKQGDLVEIDLSSLQQLKKPSTLDIPILFEDKDLLICNKPPGIVSDNKYFIARFPDYKNGLELVHRLDKETSGIIILAKNSASKEKMEELFSKREVRKTYMALVDGKFQKSSGVIDNYLGKKHSYQGQTIYGAVPKTQGVHAITKWKVLKQGAKATLLLCEPLTGRTHQLRAHLSGLGHPILGDHQYGKNFSCPLQLPRHLLHAYHIQFPHPFTGKNLEIHAPLPKDFLEALNSVVL